MLDPLTFCQCIRVRLSFKYKGQCNHRPIYYNLTLFPKVNGDTASDVGLHLSHAPVGLMRVFDQLARLKMCVQVGHVFNSQVEGAMSNANSSLAALVGSRLCHDLISPVGAIQNGLELLSLSGMDQDSPEMVLIQESCESATARIRFFRVAFGAASEGQMMSQREVVGTLDGVTKGGRMRFDWRDTGDLPRASVQMAFLSFLCCESALPHGGTVRFDRDAAGWSIHATGTRLMVDAPLWDHLNGSAPLPEPAPDKVHFALLPILAKEAGAQILARIDETAVTLKIA